MKTSDCPENRAHSAERRADILAYILIALATFLVFSGSLRNGFLTWDDDVNFLTNPHYRGLGWANLRWMFTTSTVGHYQPLVWLTCAVDYLVWGMNPFGYHLTNVLLHAANATLVYALAAWFMRRSAVPSSISPRLLAGLAALLFAVHPLRAESVAWVTERKDVLSGFFCLWAVYAYLRRHGDEGPSGKKWPVVCWAAFTMALLSKSMVMTLPAVFIILDFYPLRRLPAEARHWFGVGYRRIWLEKLPFLIPAFLVALAEYAGEQKQGAIFVENIFAHCARASFGLAFYLWKTIWPVHLCPLYELPVPFDAFAWPFLVSAAVVVCMIAGLLLTYRRWPAIAAAWACYAVTLAPVLGFVSFGIQLVADRYSYLSCLPWALLAASGFGWAWRSANAWGRRLLSLGAILVVVGLAGLTWQQVQVWRDSESLWRYVIALRPGTSVAHNNLGVALAAEGKAEEAIAHYLEALRIRPDYADAHCNLGAVLAGQGKLDDAIAQLREALRLRPDYDYAHDCWAYALLRSGRLEEAVWHYRESLRIKPDSAEVHGNLGLVLAGQGKVEEAIAHYREALRIRPDYPEARYNLAAALARQGSLPNSR